MARCMLLDAKLHNKYWGEAVYTANYLQNRLITRSKEKTPFELWFGEKPNVKHLRIFGCDAYAHIPKEQRRKLDVKAKRLTFVGYSEMQKRYRLLDTTTNSITISRDVKFIENPGTLVEIDAKDIEENQIDIQIKSHKKSQENLGIIKENMKKSNEGLNSEADLTDYEDSMEDI